MHRRLALPGLLVALALALIAGASLAALHAQTPRAKFDENGVLQTPVGTIRAWGPAGSDGSRRCLETPVEFRFANFRRDLEIICVTTVGGVLFGGDRPFGGTDLESILHFDFGLAFEVFSPSGVSLVERPDLANPNTGLRFVSSAIFGAGEPLGTLKKELGGSTTGDWGSVDDGDSVYFVLTYHQTLDDDWFSGDDDDIPDVPDGGTATRSSDYGEATINWHVVGPIVEYEIERLTAVTVKAGDSTRIEYGDSVRFLLPGTNIGVDSYIDNTVLADKTYQYRIRASRGFRNWSDWSGFVFTGAKPEVDIDPPSNVRLSRAHDNSEVTVSWTAPVGELDNYTLQRQEMVVVEGSTMFANAVTLGGNNWIDGATTTYTDSSILPGSTYEYRLASVVDDGLGDYTAWARSSPRVTSLGGAPENLRYVDDSTARMLDDRREYRMAWDEMDGVDEYEVEVLVYQVASGEQTMEDYIVTDPSFFRTSYGRADIRVRGRRADDDLCGSGDDDYCYSEWTGWYGVRFTPKVTIEAPVAVDDTADQDIVDLRESTTEAIEASLSAAGAPVDASLVVQFLTVLAATVIGGISVALGWRLGMAPLGIGMGASIAILILFTGYRLYDVPLAWPVAIQAALAVAGMFALVRQTGALR